MPSKPLASHGHRTRSATHAALSIEEIFFAILEHVYDDGNGRKDLRSLALTAKWLSSPALEVLWRDIPSAKALYNIILARDERFDNWLGEQVYYEPETELGIHLHKISVETSGLVTHRAAWYFHLIKSLRWEYPSGSPFSATVDILGRDSEEESCSTVLDVLAGLTSDMTLDTQGLKPHSMTLATSGLLKPPAPQQNYPFWNHPIALTNWLKQSSQDHGSTPAGLHLFLLESLINSCDLLMSPSVPVFVNLTSLSLQLHDPPALDNITTLPRLQSLSIDFVVPTWACVPFMRFLSCPKLAHLGISFGTAGSRKQHYDHCLDATSGYNDIPIAIYTEGIVCADYHEYLTSFELKYDHPIMLMPRTPDEDENDYYRRLHKEYDALREVRDSQAALVQYIVREYPLLSVTSLSMSFSLHQTRITYWTQLLPHFYPHLQSLSITRPSIQNRKYTNPSVAGTSLAALWDLVSGLPELSSLTIPFDDTQIDKTACAKSASTRPRRAKDPTFTPSKACPQLKRLNVLNSGLKLEESSFGVEIDGFPWASLVRRIGPRFGQLRPDQAERICKNLRKAFSGLETIEWSDGNEHAQRWEAVRRHLHEYPHLPSCDLSQ